MSTNKPIPKLLSLIPVLIGVIWTIYSLQFLNQGIFWDLGIYEKAIDVFNASGNPYELNGYLSFVYHPLVLRFMALFGNYLGIALMGAYLASLLFFVRSLGSHRSWWLYSFLAFAYCGIGTISIGSGNVTAFFHLVLLGLLLRSISNDKTLEGGSSQLTTVFIVAVVVFSLVKPYMLAYLLIPFVSTWRTARQKSIWSIAFMAGGLLAATLLIGSLYFGPEFKSFIAAVEDQTIGKHDLGYGIVMFFYDYYSSAGPLIYRAFLMHFAITGSLLLGVLLLSSSHGLKKQPSYILLLYFVLTMLNPRLKVYDLFPALIALFIFASSLQQTIFLRWIFAIAYSISLSQLGIASFFSTSEPLIDPISAYYLTIFIIFFGLLSTLLDRKGKLPT